MKRAAPTQWLLTLVGMVLGLLLALAGPAARADTTVQQYKSFRGQVNFTGTVETMRTQQNSSYNNSSCSITGSISAKLSGVPAGATILSAQLYWTGSGTTADYSVTFDNVRVDATRQYSSRTVGNGMYYFSGAADVTSRVKSKLDPNTTYTFSGLSVNNGDPWCASQGVVGGFALLVIYSHPNEPFRLLNLYEGFQYFQNNGFTIDLGNFNVPSPLPSNVTGRIGHITWEGDATLSQGGENLLFNGKELVDTMNKSGNQFNSASNVTSDYTTYGIDFDVYTLDANYISPGQNTATTTYRSGQDLVLLSAEIVAMPFVGSADLALAMTRTGDLRVGSTAYYTLTVTNNGSDIETGPVTVVDTLPAGLKLVSASGSGWTCSNAAGNGGTTLVTCTRAGTLAAGTRATPLTITVTPNATGTYTNSATVSGMTGDGITGNNTATNTASSVNTDIGALGVVFTTEECTNGALVVTAPLDAGCHRFIGPVTAAASDTRIYVTAVANGRATAVGTGDTTVAIGLAATCLPYSNVALTYAQAGLGLDCKGTWKSLTVTVPGGKTSATLPNGSSFFYADVGRISLSLSYQGSTMGTVDFISRPTDIRFQSVFRNADNVADLMGAAGDNWKKPGPTAFAKSGEPFTLRLGALMANNAYAPSFGKEPSALKGVLANDAIDLDFQLDVFAADPLASPVVPVSESTGAIDKIVKDAFALDQNFTLNASIAGALDAKVRWFEAGYLAITPSLSDYLGTGAVPDKTGKTDQARIVSSTRVIGHFYPDHFQTRVVAPFACTADMACPTDFAPAGALYSKQPFSFSVTAFALPRDGVEQPLSLFRNLAGLADNVNANVVNGVVYRNVGLSAAVKPNDTTTAPLTGFAVDAANPLPTSSGPLDFPVMKTAGTYALGNPFSPATAASGRVAPTLFYLRASMRERLVTGPTTTKDIVVTSATLDATRGDQYEDGLMVLSGRLLVPNAFGSELLRLPLNLAAQYWNGKAWVVSGSDSSSMVGDKLVPGTNSCTRFFAAAKGAAPSACDTGAVTALGGPAIALDKGRGLLNLQSPGRTNIGSFDLTLGGTASAWLPSTKARITFGVYRSPLIYLREIYR
jgi:MSHA biogenesis protein MshQ